MRTDQARPSGRKVRRGRRGQRRNRGGNRSNPPAPAPASREKKSRSFWQKIVALFGKEDSSSGALKRANGSELGEGSGDRERRKPEFVAVNSPELYVGNLSFDASESDLFDLFRGVGSVQNAEVVCHRKTQRSKGFAFVMMGSTEEALRAVEVLHNKDYLGRRLVVSGAKSKNLFESH